MQTTKLISSISYNTPEFLKGKLCDLVRQGILDYAHWVFHKPEDDETKTHAHIVVKPNRRLDTSALRNLCIGPVIGEDKPRGVLPFRFSQRMSDWVLYSAHDPIYLLRKNETRRYHYEQSDFHSTDLDLLDEDWRECHRGSDSKIPILRDMAEAGQTWAEVLSQNFLPVNQLFQYKEIFFTFLQHKTQRDGREGHE